MYCKHCGTIISDNSQYCSACGGDQCSFLQNQQPANTFQNLKTPEGSVSFIQQMSSSQLTCPVCNSHNVSVQMQQTEVETHKGCLFALLEILAIFCTCGLYLLFLLFSSSGAEIKNKKIAICQSCGHSWKLKSCSSCGRSVPENTTVCHYCNSKCQKSSQPKWWIGLIGFIVVILLFGMIGSCGDNITADNHTINNASQTQQAFISANNKFSAWAPCPTSIDEFKYDLDVVNHIVTITQYEGRASKVWIAGSYNIEGEKYNTQLEGAVFFCDDSIASVILDEGISNIDNSCFNSCSNLVCIYLPSTITRENSGDAFDGYSLFDYIDGSLKTVYFGGNKEEWKDLVSNVETKVKNSFHVYTDCDVSAKDSQMVNMNGTKLQ